MKLVKFERSGLVGMQDQGVLLPQEGCWKISSSHSARLSWNQDQCRTPSHRMRVLLRSVLERERYVRSFTGVEGHFNANNL